LAFDAAGGMIATVVAACVLAAGAGSGVREHAQRRRAAIQTQRTKRSYHEGQKR
jgi:hypothetical protein